MESSKADQSNPRPLPWWAVWALVGLAALLSIWTWQKWDSVWIEPSDGFFPPEWQNEDLETLAWRYPIYRSNDTYQWVHIADALSEGNSIPLHHRFDEGLPEGRPNRWHSGLAYALSASGSIVATINDWPTVRGIHHSAHWLGAFIHLSALLGGSALIGQLAGRRAALLFAGLYFFNAAIAWDFAFSRLDHEAAFQFCFLFHLIGLAGLLRTEGKRPTRWALLAGISAGFCWWISATIMSALSILTTLGMLAECFLQRQFPAKLAKAILLWGSSAAGMLFAFCLLDGRLNLAPSIATIHPIFILAQLGAALVCLAILFKSKAKQASTFLAGSLCGASPLIWLFIYQEAAHPWLNPMIRRLHDYIVEFQSPFSNGLWSQAESVQAFGIGLLALVAGARWSPSFGRQNGDEDRLKAGLQPTQSLPVSLLRSLTVGLVLLALVQTRWLGLLATVGTVGLCLQLNRHRLSTLWYWSLGLLLLSAGTWAHKWITIEEKPGQIFVTDLMLQIGARDINLNLQRLSEGETIHVAMPYAFASTSALFPEVHPLGTFYWENAEGIRTSADFFAGHEVDTPIDYVVVQGGRQGAPFAKLANWVAKEDVTPTSIEASRAWKLSTQQTPEGWIEQPYYGTLRDQQFSVRVSAADLD